MVSVSPDGSKLLTAYGFSGRAVVWDAEDGAGVRKSVLAGRAHSGLVWTPDGKQLMGWGQTDGGFGLPTWDATTGQVQRRLDANFPSEPWLNPISPRVNAFLKISGGVDSSQVVRSMGASDGAVLATFDVGVGGIAPQVRWNAFAWSADGTRVMGVADVTYPVVAPYLLVRVWNAGTGAIIRDWSKQGERWGPSMGPDGTRALVFGKLVGIDDGSERTLDLPNGFAV